MSGGLALCDDELGMDIESPRCEVGSTISFDDLKRQVYSSRTCGDNLKGFVEGDDPFWMEFTDGGEAFSTLAGVHQHMTYHIEDRLHNDETLSNLDPQKDLSQSKKT